MQLTAFTDYGLRTMMFLADNPGRMCSIQEIATHYGISYNHLVKVAHRLVQLKYVQSTKGKGGGLVLAGDTAAMRLGDLVQALESNMHLAECFNPATNTCRITQSCRLKHFLHDANSAFIDSLNRHTLANCRS